LNKNRDIRAELECQRGEIVEAQPAVPQLVQCEERGSGIRAATAKTGTLGDALVHT
jgi:hypothetical protein